MLCYGGVVSTDNSIINYAHIQIWNCEVNVDYRKI